MSHLRAIICSSSLESISAMIAKLKSKKINSAVANSAHSLNSHIKSQGYQLVIIDAELEVQEVIKSINLLKENKGEVTLIVLCSNGSPEDELQNIDGINFIFSVDELIEKYDEILALPSVKGEAVISLKDDELFPIDIESIALGKNIRFDIFCRKGEDKYIRLWAIGENFSYKRLKELRQEGLSKLYIMRDYLRDYMSESVMLGESIVSKPQVACSRKVEILKGSVQAIVSSINTNGINTSIAEHGRSVCKNLTATVIKKDDLEVALESLASLPASLQNHTYTTLFLAVCAAKNIEGTKGHLHKIISNAALFHDIGKSKLPEALRAKRAVTMTDVEFQDYQRHCEFGRDMLSEVSSIPKEVATVVFAHHELGDGTGFPHQLKKRSLSIVTRMVCLANVLSHSISNPQAHYKIAISTLLNDPMANAKYGRDAIAGFMALAE
jgi:HD-GYP domain-containing protein (c-di-GMP phosphodiesterase class II)